MLWRKEQTGLNRQFRNVWQRLCKWLQCLDCNGQLWQSRGFGHSARVQCSWCFEWFVHREEQISQQLWFLCLHSGKHFTGALFAQQRFFLQRISFTYAIASHQGAQLAQSFVVHEQLACQRALVAQHVHQEPQGAQAVAQLFKSLLAFAGVADLATQQAFHRLAHACHCQRCLVQSQHRQHTTHLSKKGGNRGQRYGVLRITEELVHGALGFTQRGTQLAHHASHGLAIAEVAIKLFHP